MQHGGKYALAHLLRWVLVWLSIGCATGSLIAQTPPHVDYTHPFSGNWGPWGIVRSMAIQATADSIWEPTTRQLTINVTGVWSGSGFGGVAADDAPPNFGLVQWGWQKRVLGVESSPVVGGQDLNYSDGNRQRQATLTLAEGDEVRLWIYFEVAWNDQNARAGKFFSGWFGGAGKRYRRLDFSVTNTTGSTGWAGIECNETPQGVVFCPDLIGGKATKDYSIQNGQTRTVSIFVAEDETRLFRGVVVDLPASRAVHGVDPQLLSCTRADGSKGWYWSGCIVQGTGETSTGWKDPQESGVLSDSIPPHAGAETGQSPVPVIDPSSPKRVPDGSTGPATGKEVTDSANTIIEQAHEDAAAIQKSVDAVRAAIEAQGKGDTGTGGTGETPTTDDMASKGQAAADQIKALYGDPPPRVNYTENIAAEQPELSLTLPESFGGATFDLNPFRQDRLGPLVSWLRQAIAWVVILGLGVWIWQDVGQWTRGFSVVQQAKGNTVAGSGAQITALIAAGLMTTAIVVATTGLLSWTFGDITIPRFVSAASANPLAGIPAKALWMLDKVFPVVTILAAFAAKFSFRIYGAGLFAVCTAIVRFIVP